MSSHIWFRYNDIIPKRENQQSNISQRGRRKTPFTASNNGIRSPFASFTQKNAKHNMFATSIWICGNGSPRVCDSHHKNPTIEIAYQRKHYSKHRMPFLETARLCVSALSYRSDVDGNYWCLLTVVKSTVWRVTRA